MSFLEFLLTKLFNNRGSYDLSKYVEPDSPATGSDENISTETSTETTSEPKSLTDTLDQGETQSEETTPNLEEKLDKLEDESGDAGDLLQQINSLGLTRNGESITYDSKDKIREVLQKDFDYTAKTTEHAEVVRQHDADHVAKTEAFESERVQFDTEREDFNTTLVESEAMERVLNSLRLSDPTVFEEISTLFDTELRSLESSRNNPEVLGLRKQVGEIHELLKKTGEEKVQGENTEINSKWDTAFSELVTKHGPKFKMLGLTIDKKEVERVFRADASEKTTPMQALQAVHGEQLFKAMDARNKALELKSKSSLRQGPPNNGQTEVKEEAKKGSYLDKIMQIASAKGY